MAYIMDLEVESTLSPDECLEAAEELIDVEDVESIRENAWIIRALANNRDFVLGAYHKQLESYWAGKRDNEYQPQSVAIANSANFFIRTNIWLPIDRTSLTADFQNRLYAYELPHDHNFNFLTVGYFGEGYKTDIYEYDVADVTGYVGEKVALEHLGQHQLTPGRVMLYRAGRDIHIQYSPDTLSVSLNLMGRNMKLDSLPQYIFDVENGIIIGGAGDLLSNRLYLLNIFNYLHNDETVGILKDFASEHTCPRTQATALRVLEGIAPAEAEATRSHLPIDVGRLAANDIIAGNYARSYSNS